MVNDGEYKADVLMPINKFRETLIFSIMFGFAERQNAMVNEHRIHLLLVCIYSLSDLGRPFISGLTSGSRFVLKN